jgi:pyruvate ferredoxin oxidoreductase beta subunit
MPEIAAAHNIPYVATACHSYPFDFMDKVKQAVNTEGPSYVHVLSVCPTGWRCATDLTIRMGRLAVETGIFPLYTIENGKYKMTKEYTNLKPIREYTKLQGRFRHLPDDMLDEIQERITEEYTKLKERCGELGS